MSVKNSRILTFPKWRVFQTVTRIYSNETNKLRRSETNFVVCKLVCWKLPLFKFRYVPISSISETVRCIKAAWCGCHSVSSQKGSLFSNLFAVYRFAIFLSYSILDVLIVCDCFIQDEKKLKVGDATHIFLQCK